jgi:hypothetical protein
MKVFISIFVFAAAGVLLTGCGDKSSPKTAADTNAPSGYLGMLVDEKKSSDKKIDTAYLNQAVQLFNVQEGRYPKTLEELTPNYVAKIPEAPIGFKIDYDPVKGEVKVVAQ